MHLFFLFINTSFFLVHHVFPGFFGLPFLLFLFIFFRKLFLSNFLHSFAQDVPTISDDVVLNILQYSQHLSAFLSHCLRSGPGESCHTPFESFSFLWCAFAWYQILSLSNFQFCSTSHLLCVFIIFLSAYKKVFNHKVFQSSLNFLLLAHNLDVTALLVFSSFPITFHIYFHIYFHIFFIISITLISATFIVYSTLQPSVDARTSFVNIIFAL